MSIIVYNLLFLLARITRMWLFIKGEHFLLLLLLFPPTIFQINTLVILLLYRGRHQIKVYSRAITW